MSGYKPFYFHPSFITNKMTLEAVFILYMVMVYHRPSKPIYIITMTTVFETWMQDAQELFIFYIQLSERLLKLTNLQVIIHRHLVYKVGLFFNNRLFNKCGYANLYGLVCCFRHGVHEQLWYLELKCWKKCLLTKCFRKTWAQKKCCQMMSFLKKSSQNKSSWKKPSWKKSS